MTQARSSKRRPSELNLLSLVCALETSSYYYLFYS